MVIPRFVQSAIKNEPVNIFGDGSQTRVFCHVTDAVKAIQSLILDDKSIGEVFNIGGKNEISIIELAELIISITSSKSKISFVRYEDAYLAGFEDVIRRVPDIRKIKSFTNWEPKINIETIIKDVLNSSIKEI
jgi:UDP-glucose 4-epimerase